MTTEQSPTHHQAAHRHSADHEHHTPEQPADTAAFWDALYGERDQIWSGRVNAGLADRVAALPPGAALDLGCGEGGDAIWLAQQGWTVTGVDVSAVAVERAHQHARDAGVADRITVEQRDVTTGLPDGPFDLVSAQFFQSPIALDADGVLRAAAERVAPGGTLLVISHAAPPPWANSDHEHSAFPTPAETVTALLLDGDGWDLVEAAVVEREAVGPDGQPGMLADCVVQARRV